MEKYMRPSEVQAFLEANESEMIRIVTEVEKARKQANQMIIRMKETLRNTHFKSRDEQNYAHGELRDFIDKMLKPFREE